ncbi:hypothetical protein H072_1312, partial [Dactylellina haptotyla CBS 200.50]
RKLFSIPLDKPFPAHSLISPSTYTAIDLPDGPPIGSDAGIFLYTNTTLWFYEPDSDSSNGTSIWTFNAQNETFSQVSVGGGENVPFQIFAGGYASDPATGTMYYTGSYRNSQKRRRRKRRTLGSGGVGEYEFELDKRAPTRPWMQILDASRGDGNATWLSGAGRGPTLLYGTLQYVRYGKKGILVGFGGVDPDDDSQFADSNVAGYRSMTEIFVFDIDSQRWYTVDATGGGGSSDIPDGRLNFCAGVSAAPDDSSFQITIYGGYKLSNAAPTNKVHVLILPTFQWLDVTPKDQSLGDDQWGRQSPKCLMWNDAQMIVLGGIIQGNNARNNSVVNTGSCNATHPPVLVLDTTSFTWADTFNPNRSYSQPKQVYDLIGGDWRGFNGRTAPPNGGFGNADLSNIFATTVRRIDQPTTFSTSTPTTGPGGGGDGGSGGGSGSTSNTGAIAGGVIAGVAGLALIGGLIWWFLRKRRRGEPPMIPAPETRPMMNRFEKPELDGTAAHPQPQPPPPQEQVFDPLKAQNNGPPMELAGDATNGVRPGLVNQHSVYELDSGVARGELPATTTREEHD